MISAKKSTLQLLEFYIVEYHTSLIDQSLPDDEASRALYFGQYEILIDFHHKDEDENRFLTFVNIKVNDDEKYQGYKIECSGAGVFSFFDDSIEKDSTAYQNLKFYSTVNMVINQLRNVIAVNTAYGPLGRFNLPALDIGDLFKKKMELQKKGVFKKKTTKKKD